MATSGKREKSLRLLCAAGYDPGSFDAYVTAEDVVNPKPAPDLFLEAARRLGLTPRQCVVIEDAPSGVEAARRAGMACVAVVQTVPPDQLAGATRIVSCVDELGLEGLLQLARTGTEAGAKAYPEVRGKK